MPPTQQTPYSKSRNAIIHKSGPLCNDYTQIGPPLQRLYTNLNAPATIIHKLPSPLHDYSQTCPKSVKKGQKVKITASFCPKVTISDTKYHPFDHEISRKRITRKKGIFWLFFFRK